MGETCTTEPGCGQPAVCRYDWGQGERYGCAAHDPARPGLTATVRMPSVYQSLPVIVSVTSGPGFAPHAQVVTPGG